MLAVFIHSSWGDPGNVANLTDRSITNTSIKVCHAGVKIGSDGALYTQHALGGWSAIDGEWFVNGSAGGFYVSKTLESGTLTTDAGAGPIQTNVDRIYDIQEATTGLTKTAVITINISDDITGLPILATAVFSLSATKRTPGP